MFWVKDNAFCDFIGVKGVVGDDGPQGRQGLDGNKGNWSLPFFSRIKWWVQILVLENECYLIQIKRSKITHSWFEWILESTSIGITNWRIFFFKQTGQRGDIEYGDIGFPGLPGQDGAPAPYGEKGKFNILKSS